MAAYPRTQSKVSTLVESMIAGFDEHPDDFPSVDVAALRAARDEYQTASDALVSAQAQAALAAETKADKLEKLNAVTKIQLKLSQVDSAETPQKLHFIGWAPRADSQATRPPHQPGDLKIIFQNFYSNHTNHTGHAGDTPGGRGDINNSTAGDINNSTADGKSENECSKNVGNGIVEKRGVLHLRWKKSAFKRARFVRFYSIERRSADGEEIWRPIASSLTNEILLENEPTAVRFEYRVKAVNAAGESFATNIVTVTL